MANEQRQAARRVFMEVADLTAEERDVALSEACGDDVALRAEVEALLRAEAQAGGFMAEPTDDRLGTAATAQSIDVTMLKVPREQPGQHRTLAIDLSFDGVLFRGIHPGVVQLRPKLGPGRQLVVHELPRTVCQRHGAVEVALLEFEVAEERALGDFAVVAPR